MKTQIYNLNTLFNFGKFTGKSLREVIEIGESRYIGWLIINNVKRFIMDPDTITYLDDLGFFDDLEFSHYGPLGNMSFNDLLGFNKQVIIKDLKDRHQEFLQDPDEYEKGLNIH